MIEQTSAENTASPGMLAWVCEITDQNITRVEVDQTLKKLNARKAAGLDEILEEYLKLEDNACGEWLVGISKVYLTLRRVPMNWKAANIVPLHSTREKATHSTVGRHDILSGKEVRYIFFY